LSEQNSRGNEIELARECVNSSFTPDASRWLCCGLNLCGVLRHIAINAIYCDENDATQRRKYSLSCTVSEI